MRSDRLLLEDIRDAILAALSADPETRPPDQPHS